MNPPGTEILRPISKFKRRNKISSLLVYVLHKTRNWAFSRRSRAKTGEEMYKKSVMQDALAKLLFCYKNLLFFWRSRCRPRLWILKSLMTRVHARRSLFGTTAATATIKKWIRGFMPKLGEQGWRSGESARLPPMWPGFNSGCRRHIWVEFAVGSLPCSERFFSWFSGFPLSSKTNTSKFQFDLERTDTFKRVHMNSYVPRG